MKTIKLVFLLPLLLTLAGCSVLDSLETPPPIEKYDLGPLPDADYQRRYSVPGGLRIGEINAPAALQNNNIQYRLLYKERYVRNAYGYSQWTTTIKGLIQQRLYALLAPRVEGGVSQPLAATRDKLRLELTLGEFIQEFPSPEQAQAVVSFQVQLIDRTQGEVVAHRSFSGVRQCETPDVKGGVSAMAGLMDELLLEMLIWLPSQLPR